MFLYNIVLCYKFINIPQTSAFGIPEKPLYLHYSVIQAGEDYCVPFAPTSVS